MPGQVELKSDRSYSTSGDMRSMNALLTPGQLAIPIRDLYLGGSGLLTIEPRVAQLNQAGRLSLTVASELWLTFGAQACRLSGSITLNESADADVLSGHLEQRDLVYDSADCHLIASLIDLSAGIGLTLRAAWSTTQSQDEGAQTTEHAKPLPTSKQRQTLLVELPRRIRKKRVTVLLRRAPQTSAGQVANVQIRWSPRRQRGARTLQLTRKPNGRLAIKPTGRAKRLRVEIRITAPPTSTHLAMDFQRDWKVSRTN